MVTLKQIKADAAAKRGGFGFYEELARRKQEGPDLKKPVIPKPPPFDLAKLFTAQSRPTIKSGYPLLDLLEPVVDLIVNELLPKLDAALNFFSDELRSGIYGVKNTKLLTQSNIAFFKRFGAEHEAVDIKFQNPSNLRAKIKMKVDIFTPSGYNIKTATKEPIVFFHGIYSDANAARTLGKELLGKGYPLILFAYPGFAGQRAQPNAKNLTAGAKAVLELVKQRSYPQVSIVAHSLGAAIASKALAEMRSYPLKKLVLVSPLEESGLAEIFKKITDRFPRLIQYATKLEEATHRIFENAWYTFNHLTKFTEHNKSTEISLIHGDQDPICDDTIAKKLVEASQITKLSSRGHFTALEEEQQPYDQILTALAS